MAGGADACGLRGLSGGIAKIGDIAGQDGADMCEFCRLGARAAGLMGVGMRNLFTGLGIAA